MMTNLTIRLAACAAAMFGAVASSLVAVAQSTPSASPATAPATISVADLAAKVRAAYTNLPPRVMNVTFTQRDVDKPVKSLFFGRVIQTRDRYDFTREMFGVINGE